MFYESKFQSVAFRDLAPGHVLVGIPMSTPW